MNDVIKTLFIVAIALVLAGCGNKKGNYDASGTFEATEVIVSAQAVGEIKQFDLFEGQTVRENQLLGYIDSDVQQRQLAAQRVALQNNYSSQSVAQMAQLDDQINKSLIKAPISGTVLSKYAEQGELATQGRALFKMADMEQIYLRAYITADQLNQWQLNQEVPVFADFGKDKMREYRGVITWISDKAEFTPRTVLTKNERANQVYAVKIAVKNDGYLKIGMYGEVRIND
ncbi:MAG: efflux RND transporter periplasmic adaptor subunit [Candidatus Symbiothrix sp.]|jgi:HlyD family secretion protein|nr:efflux RND transporter periplasmic adaptor subunit [Candidatus Symbiothrix sp.]